ncbi:MAG: proline--tRNA ligase [Planctomycetota bacterium]
MRWTNTLVPTLKETPAEADARSHVLMLRAGLIRKLGSGTYTYLPLGRRIINKISAIVREEMNRAGASELLMPALWPAEILEESGRLEVFGDDVITFTDRHGREGVLGPTHEEIITMLVRDNINSYRDLPLNLYQIQTKYRDEVRPRFGILRTREFLMKDAYSFDTDEQGMQESYDAMYRAYRRIFDRCGLDYVVVDAESGAMGGSGSQEFMVRSKIGDDRFVSCENCGYAANVERAEIGPVPQPEVNAAEPELKEVDTPGASTIEEVSDMLEVSPTQMIKTLIYLADGRPVTALLRGDHDLNENKLARQVDATNLELADATTIESVTGAPLGFSGPVGLDGTRVIADHAVMGISDGVTGANKADAHLTGVVPGRDFEPDGTADLRMAQGGDPCPACESAMDISHGIEVGHVFQLGTKYSKALEATFQDEDGQEKPCIMGCYGIGINRIAAAAVESFSDENGIIWPPSIAPFEVCVMPLTNDSDEVLQVANNAYETLQAEGIDVIIDDREESPGSKFKDADLIGFPLRVIVGRGYQKTGNLELQVRHDGNQREVPPAQLTSEVSELLDELKA